MNDNHTPHKAENYNAEIEKTIPHYTSFHGAALSVVKAYKPNVKHWIDTGCGTGNLIERALKEFPECRFYLSDPSKQMVQICKDKFRDKRVEILGEYQTGELDKSTEPEVITAIQSHHYLRYKERISTTKHCFDMLRPDGMYIAFENIKPDTESGIKTGLKRWADYQRRHGKTKSEAESHVERFDKHYFPIKISEHLEIMKKAGFKTVELLWMSYMQAGFYGIKSVH